MKRILSLSSLVAVLLAAGCGGGGGGGGGSTSLPSDSPAESGNRESEFPVSYRLITYQGGVDVTPEGLDVRDVRHMPVWRDGSAHIVGIHSDAGVRLPRAGSRGDTDLRYGTRDDGNTRERLVRFIEGLYGDRIETARLASGLPSPSLIRVVGPATEIELGGVVRALQSLNAALPPGRTLDLEFSPGRSRDPFEWSSVSGEITLSFIPDSEWIRGAEWIAENENIDHQAGYSTTHIGAGTGDVWMRRASGGDRVFIDVIVHEIIHALTGAYHNEIEGVSSIMTYVGDPEMSVIDREFLHLLFTRPDHVGDPADFGPWDDTATYIHGSNGHATFGVAMRGTPGNRFFEPWGSGWSPDHYGGGYSSLSRNPDLSGTVTWNGTLVGFTPGENPVVGDAELRVSMSNLSGQADFTGLEQWTAGTAPGGAGSGTMWGDGDLSYRLDITGNRFRDGAGSADDGRLTGAFVGYSHEGVTGTLVRDDLTAAFGATR